MNLYETIIIGIVTGILTTFLLFIAGQIFIKIILPWYQGIIYQGVNIEGNWKHSVGHAENEMAHEFNIKQSAHNITGFGYFKIKQENIEKTIPFKIQGYLWEGYLIVNWLPIERRKLSYATGLYKVSSGGESLDGHTVFRNLQEDESLSIKALYKLQ